ncbi:hypothetical protein EYZ11_000031 [Aspergillus tanneri]|uniref:Uncharacterized protein n=1 Tax=Aspergillus tanneri TaxID=1220188 RepID=A0A4S3JY31_9EURO|nr:uncharacterized protein ATNIH1004_000642 [Aspergillus tanneri]KAA8651746.1 hypothetical protein ATNIH1004_000642 [Aspergillus tanneri]THD00467.1 hypothetical protein EYZ11_000031 [Aspergillus tanneri]
MRLEKLFLFTLLSTTTATANVHPNRTAHVWTTFVPECPFIPQGMHYEVDIHRESPTTVYSEIGYNTCVSVPVPRRHTQLEVNHVSIGAEMFMLNHQFGVHDQCNLTLHELPGCEQRPLIEKDIRSGRPVGDCEQRSFLAFNQVWLKLSCQDERHIVVQNTSASLNRTRRGGPWRSRFLTS